MATVAGGLAIVATWRLLDSPGTTDVVVFQHWLANVDSRGLIAGYQANQSTYPPFTSVAFFIAARMGHLIGISDFVAIKCSLALFLILSVIAIWGWSRNPVIAVVAYWALILNSVGLGYVDIYLVPSLVLALWALREGRVAWFTVFYSVSCLTKWQPLIIAPFVIVYLFGAARHPSTRTRDWRWLLTTVLLPGGLVFCATIGVFGLPVLSSLAKAMSDSRLSGNALNLGWIATFVLETMLPGWYGGLVNREVQCIDVHSTFALLPQRVLMAGVYSYLLLAFARSPKTYKRFVLCALLGYLAYFVFNSGVHENHLVPAMVMGLALVQLDTSRRLLSAVLIAVSNFNMFLFYGIHGKGFRRVLLMDVSVPVAVVIVLGCAWLIRTHASEHGEMSG